MFETSRQRGCFHPENKLFDETLVSVSFSWKHTFSARCQVVLHTGVNTLVSYVCFRATNYSFKTRVSHFYNCCSTSFWRFQTSRLLQNRPFLLASCRPRHQLLSVYCTPVGMQPGVCFQRRNTHFHMHRVQFFFAKPLPFRQLQDMLYNDLKIKSGTLHPGKYVVADAGNIQLIDHPKFWIDASETF